MAAPSFVHGPQWKHVDQINRDRHGHPVCNIYDMEGVVLVIAIHGPASRIVMRCNDAGDTLALPMGKFCDADVSMFTGATDPLAALARVWKSSTDLRLPHLDELQWYVFKEKVLCCSAWVDESALDNSEMEADGARGGGGRLCTVDPGALREIARAAEAPPGPPDWGQLVFDVLGHMGV
jgi:hypothetical protein